MKEYMTSVFAVSALLSFLSLVSYKSSLESTRKLTFGLILLSVVITPAIAAVGEISKFDVKEFVPKPESSQGDLPKLYESAFADGIADAVCEKFELRRSDVRVLVEGFVSVEWRCEKIRIILSGVAVFADTAGIERFINRLDIGECEAEIEIG